jgi:hypothetical protein
MYSAWKKVGTWQSIACSITMKYCLLSSAKTAMIRGEFRTGGSLAKVSGEDVFCVHRKVSWYNMN